MGSCLFKYNLVLINLFDMGKYVQIKDLKFEDVFTNIVVHEALHILMQEVSASAEAEEEIVYSMIGLP